MKTKQQIQDEIANIWNDLLARGQHVIKAIEEGTYVKAN